VGKVCLSIQLLLQCPNPDDPLDNGVAKVYKETPELARKNAEEWTKLYAR
jgi:ubiquitin-protein ligase